MSTFGEDNPAAEGQSRGEALFGTLVETIPAGVFLYHEGKTVYVNQAAARITGYTSDELLQLDNFWDIVHPDSRPLLMESYAAHMRGEPISQYYEIKILTKCGEARWVQFTFDWVTSGPEQGDLVGTGVDITEAREAQDALRSKRDQLQAVFDAFPDLLLRMDRQGTILEYIASPTRSFYRSPEDSIGQKTEDLLPPAAAAIVTTAIAAVAESRTASAIEYSLPFPEGERLFQTQVIPFEEDQIIILARDITRRKQAEASLKESEARLLAFAHAVPDVTFILDEDGLYVEILGRAASSDLLYKQSAELKGRRLHDVLPADSADAFLSVIRKTIESQQQQVLEYELDLDVGRRCFEGRTAPLPVDGKRRMVVWLALDITARKSDEQELVELREELDRKAERTISQGTEHGLTFRELTVLQLVVAGQSDKEIGWTLGISPLTANKHVGNILRKLKVSSRTSASVIALRDGLVS